MPVILRMNIEGAEQFVIQDLIDAGLHRSIDGYYGMWDDLSKVDPSAAKTFRRLLRDNGISTITFNDRDLETSARRGLSLSPRQLAARFRQLSFTLRQHAIRSDLDAALRAGLDRAGAAASGSGENNGVPAASPAATAQP